MLMNTSLVLQLAENSMKGWVMQINLGAPGGDWLEIGGAAWEVRRAGCGWVRQVRLRSDALGTNRTRLAACCGA